MSEEHSRRNEETDKRIRYMTPGQIMSRYQMCRRAVNYLLKGMERSGRYPEGSIIRTPRSTLVLDAALHDFMKNRVALENNLQVEEYSAKKMRRELARLEM